ncbi:hypothetical protein CONCODRAFT_12563 [Conidiobolus coronatus NRRL 28638]|uniref:Uncharacterized protein n=1 Tax=Conidiobolus coronatus (strain ATCC 28846 / CBS 209.66 / NRRL 28638) TaxID=796925 RepID=A0A137NSN1_CONC2|nr:hypothetical protein CONCODRAFT_12563 [Conidiobolus coronatus NRRL 28638]|eukprot:KXN65744.1 hypothetical protein CONCODRAFT_12563 [Conidiobolus coronatus NRRL 28638]
MSEECSDESSVAKSVSDSIERSWSHTKTDEQHGSVSDQVSNTLTKSVELSLGYSKTNTVEGSSTTTNTEENNTSDTASGDRNSMKYLNPLGFPNHELVEKIILVISIPWHPLG